MCVSHGWESYGGGPCLSGRREKADKDLRDGSQGLLFLSGASHWAFKLCPVPSLSQGEQPYR